MSPSRLQCRPRFTWVDCCREDLVVDYARRKAHVVLEERDDRVPQDPPIRDLQHEHALIPLVWERSSPSQTPPQPFPRAVVDSGVGKERTPVGRRSQTQQWDAFLPTRTRCLHLRRSRLTTSAVALGSTVFPADYPHPTHCHCNAHVGRN